MFVGILTDLIIVLVLQVSREAVQTAMEFSLSPLQQAHVFSSSVAVLLYFPVIALGLLRYKNIYGKGVRLAHIRLGLLAFIFRSLGFIFMFSLVGR